MSDRLLPGLHQIAPGSPMLPEVVSGPERYEYLSFLILARNALKEELASKLLKRPTDPRETYRHQAAYWEKHHQPYRNLAASDAAPAYRSLAASDAAPVYRNMVAVYPPPRPRAPLGAEVEEYNEQLQAWNSLYEKLEENLKTVESRMSTNLSPRYVAAMKQLLLK